MEPLITKITNSVDNISGEQAQQVVDVVTDTLRERLPDPLAKPVIETLQGEEFRDQVSSLADGALSKLGIG